MKLKSDLILRQVADTWVVLPMTRDVLSFNGIVRLNESGALLWNVLKETENRQAMVNALVHELGIEKQIAETDVDELVNVLGKAGCLEE